ncbi:MAG TPA: hypothetical protein VFX70_18725 [Mycobacteriales bacterium]|nr:hypothetical protein [Mycobacteriales bacterium]
MAYSSGASGLVSLDMSALINDFTNLAASAEIISRYNTVLAQTNTDIQTLKTDCNAA